MHKAMDWKAKCTKDETTSKITMASKAISKCVDIKNPLLKTPLTLENGHSIKKFFLCIVMEAEIRGFVL